MNHKIVQEKGKYKPREKGSQEHANITDIDGNMKQMKEMIDHTRGEHEPRINGSSYDSSQGIPREIIKPIQKFIKSMVDKLLRCAVIEPGIKFVDDTLKAHNREEARGEGGQPN